MSGVMTMLRLLVVLTMLAIPRASQAAQVWQDEFLLFMGGGFTNTSKADPVTHDLLLGVTFKGQSYDSLGHRRLTYSSWGGIVNVTIETVDSVFMVGTLMYSGVYDRASNSVFKLPGAENDFITVFSDKTWTCTGRCENSIQNYKTKLWEPSGEIFSSGTYQMSVVPLPASLPLLASVLSVLGLTIRRRKAQGSRDQI